MKCRRGVMACEMAKEAIVNRNGKRGWSAGAMHCAVLFVVGAAGWLAPFVHHLQHLQDMPFQHCEPLLRR